MSGHTLDWVHTASDTHTHSVTNHTRTPTRVRTLHRLRPGDGRTHGHTWHRHTRVGHDCPKERLRGSQNVLSPGRTRPDLVPRRDPRTSSDRTRPGPGPGPGVAPASTGSRPDVPAPHGRRPLDVTPPRPRPTDDTVHTRRPDADAPDGHDTDGCPTEARAGARAASQDKTPEALVTHEDGWSAAVLVDGQVRHGPRRRVDVAPTSPPTVDGCHAGPPDAGAPGVHAATGVTSGRRDGPDGDGTAATSRVDDGRGANGALEESTAPPTGARCDASGDVDTGPPPAPPSSLSGPPTPGPPTSGPSASPGGSTRPSTLSR